MTRKSNKGKTYRDRIKPNHIFDPIADSAAAAANVINETLGINLVTYRERGNYHLYSRRMPELAHVTNTCLLKFENNAEDPYTGIQRTKDHIGLQKILADILSPLSKIAPIFSIGSSSPLNGAIATDGTFRKFAKGVLVPKNKKNKTIANLDASHNITLQNRGAIHCRKSSKNYAKQIAESLTWFKEHYNNKDVIIFDDSFGYGVSSSLLYLAMKRFGINMKRVHFFSLILEHQTKKK